MDLRTGAEGGGGQVHRRGAGGLFHRSSLALGQGDARAAALAAVKIPLFPQLAERAGDGRAANAQRRRQLALAGQARFQRQAAVKDQQPQGFCQLAPASFPAGAPKIAYQIDEKP